MIIHNLLLTREEGGGENRLSAKLYFVHLRFGVETLIYLLEFQFYFFFQI